MLIFMKNVKKFVMKERPVLAAVHYHAGRAYASNVYSLVWIEDNLRREGAFDAESGAPVELDAKMPTPSFDKVVPKVNEDSAYATVGNAELIQMLSVLKAVDACAPNRKDSDAVMLVWRASGFIMYARGILSFRKDGELGRWGAALCSVQRKASSCFNRLPPTTKRCYTILCLPTHHIPFTSRYGTSLRRVFGCSHCPAAFHRS